MWSALAVARREASGANLMRRITPECWPARKRARSHRQHRPTHTAPCHLLAYSTHASTPMTGRGGRGRRRLTREHASMRLVASAVALAPSPFLHKNLHVLWLLTLAPTYYLPTNQPHSCSTYTTIYLHVPSLLLHTLARAPLVQPPFMGRTDGQQQHAPDKALRVPCSKASALTRLHATWGAAHASTPDCLRVGASDSDG